ncbi:hypothetical protein B0H63DRAFT_456693 [Podospora didyma]|uniref:Uncharacterized protein n=1 Tax=Podospora didyma TaxID=330526 RepID=A0AAE0P428_9PEZI|nr:hypothetical protein B0H63DRAFT_456693 [Podospora didyma]
MASLPNPGASKSGNTTDNVLPPQQHELIASRVVSNEVLEYWFREQGFHSRVNLRYLLMWQLARLVFILVPYILILQAEKRGGIPLCTIRCKIQLASVLFWLPLLLALALFVRHHVLLKARLLYCIKGQHILAFMSLAILSCNLYAVFQFNIVVGVTTPSTTPPWSNLTGLTREKIE